VDKGKGKAPAEVSTIFMLPVEFRANDDDEGSREEVSMAQWVCQAEMQPLRSLRNSYI
jgi:hypothetical protein